MTLLEKAKEMGLTTTDDQGYLVPAVQGCPSTHGLTTQESDYAFCPGHNCEECYAREYVEPASTQNDTQRHFDTGAVRDDATGKGRFDLLPWGAIHALARHCERGALHYGERNVDKGIPQHSLIDSAQRHLALYVQGDPEPYHLVAALWNIAWAAEQEIKRPELVDLPERQGCTSTAV